MAILNRFNPNYSRLHVGSSATVDLTARYGAGATPAAKATVIKTFMTPSGAVPEASVGSVSGGSYVKLTDNLTDTIAYFKNVGTSAATIATGELTFSGLSAKLSFWSSEIPFTKTLGDLGSDSTIIDLPQFNKRTKGKLQGQIDGGQLDAEMYYVPGNEILKWMRDQHNASSRVVIGIRYAISQNAAPKDTHLVAFESFVATNGRTAPFDDATMSPIAFPCDGEQFETPGDV